MSIQQKSTRTEPTREEVGYFGMAWVNWMKIHHKKLVQELKNNKSFVEVAKSVNADAEDYLELLEGQYESRNPRPLQYEETVRWEQTRDFYTHSIVMREQVLHPYTQP
jgi:hypothetical protein